MQRKSITEINYANRWMEIYPVDNAIQRLNNRGQNFSLLARSPFTLLSRDFSRLSQMENLLCSQAS